MSDEKYDNIVNTRRGGGKHGNISEGNCYLFYYYFGLIYYYFGLIKYVHSIILRAQFIICLLLVSTLVFTLIAYKQVSLK